MDSQDIQYAPKLISDLLDVIRNAIIVIDYKHQIIFANSWTNKMFNTKNGELYGIDIRNIFMKEDRDILASNIINITKKEREFESEAMLQRFNGTIFPALLASTFFLWDDGKEGMAFTIHDLTELKDIEKSLRRSEKIAFLGNLIHDISHQIRNPVMVIGGLARRLKSNSDTTTIKASAIIKETGRLEELLTTLDKFIMLPNPKTEKITFLNLKLTTDNMLQKKTEDTGCQWTCTFDKNISEHKLLLDVNLFLQALENIVINCCESYDKEAENKKIMTHFSLSTDLIFPYVITITDEGRGIPENKLPYVFNHFYSDKTSHIGMGLTFAQRIIDLQDGKMSIHSKPSQGTTVAIYLLNERRRTIRTTKLTQ